MHISIDTNTHLAVVACCAALCWMATEGRRKGKG
jgi:hypothetical protein